MRLARPLSPETLQIGLQDQRIVLGGNTLPPLPVTLSAGQRCKAQPNANLAKPLIRHDMLSLLRKLVLIGFPIFVLRVPSRIVHGLLDFWEGLFYR